LWTTTSSGQYPHYPRQPVVPWGYQVPYQQLHQYPQPSPPPQQQQQEQQQQPLYMLVINRITTVAHVQTNQSFSDQIVVSLLVLFCCNFLFGLIGYILATIARDKAVHDPKTANKFGKASYGVSIGGVLLSVLMVMIIFTMQSTLWSSSTSSSSHSSSSSCAYYSYMGSCYRNRDCTFSYDSCVSYYDGEYSSSSCCYYN
jgi:hypothetical protein